MKFSLTLLLFIVPSIAYSQEPTDYAKLAIAQQVAKDAINNYTPVNSIDPTTSSLPSVSKQLERQPTKEPLNVTTNNSCARTVPVECSSNVPLAPIQQQANCQTTIPLQRAYSPQANCATQASTIPLQENQGRQRVRFLFRPFQRLRGLCR